MFDDVCNSLLAGYHQLDEMAIKKLKKFDDFKPDPSFAKYSIADTAGDDPEIAKQIIVLAVKKILDDLDEYPDATFPGKRTEYQDKVAGFIRQAINEVVPTSEKPTKKPFTARDFYAVREIARAMRDQGIVLDDSKGSREAVAPMDDAQKSEVAATIADNPTVQNKVDAVIDQVAEEPVSDEDESSDIEPETKPTVDLPPADKNSAKFDPHAIYVLNPDIDQELFNDRELRILDRLEDGMTGAEIVNTLKTSLAYRDYPELIKPLVQKFVHTGALKPMKEDIEDGDDFGVLDPDDPDYVADELGIDVPREDPYSGSLRDY